MVTLTPIVRDDLDELFALDVTPSQRGYVAPNAVTIAEMSYMPGGYSFTIRQNEVIVGLVALVDFREHDDLLEGDDPNAAFMMRLMIDSKSQRQGIGREATKLAITWAIGRHNSCFQTSIVPGNEPARRLYLSLGLRETGRIVEDEIEMSLVLEY